VIRRDRDDLEKFAQGERYTVGEQGIGRPLDNHVVTQFGSIRATQPPRITPKEDGGP
jgi:hypothetical protein